MFIAEASKYFVRSYKLMVSALTPRAELAIHTSFLLATAETCFSTFSFIKSSVAQNNKA